AIHYRSRGPEDTPNLPAGDHAVGPGSRPPSLPAIASRMAGTDARQPRWKVDPGDRLVRSDRATRIATASRTEARKMLHNRPMTTAFTLPVAVLPLHSSPCPM